MKENMALMIMVFNGLMLFGADFTWTEVSRVKENKYYKDGVVHQLGYAEINQNKQEVTVSNHYDCSCYYSPAYSKYVTEIRSCANNSKLRKITVKNDPPLTSGHFFRGDYNIENIVNEAFKNCTALQTVILP